MAEGECEIVIGSRAEDRRCLSIHAREPAGKLVTLDIAIEWSAGGFRTSSTFFGYDLNQFLHEMVEMHRALGGTARLANTCGEVEITFRVADRARGRIAVDGRIAQSPPLREEGWRRANGPAPLEFRFAGVETDQSYLPQIVRTLSEYIRLTGLSTEHPMAG